MSRRRVLHMPNSIDTSNPVGEPIVRKTMSRKRISYILNLIQTYYTLRR